MKRSEGFFEGYQDARLFFQTWEPPSPQGLLVITHGHGEHSECYSRLVDALADEPWKILAWDLPGHGRSDGQRGYIPHFMDFTHDFEALYASVLPKEGAGLPKVFFGHSMGALVQMKALAGIFQGDRETQILSSPYLGLALQIPAYKEAAAVLFRHLLPQITLSNEIRDQDLTRDPEVQQEFARDSLRHHKISPEVFLGAQECQASVLARPDIWKGPLLMLLAEDDPVVSTKVNVEFFKQLRNPGKLLQIFKDRKHELINDLGREEILQKIRVFLHETLVHKGS